MSFFIFASALAQTKTDEKETKTEVKTVKEEVKATEPESSSSNNSSMSNVREIHKHAVGLGVGETFLFGKMESYGDNSITTDLFYSYTASYSFDLLIGMHESSHHYKDKNVNLQGYTASIKGRYVEYDSFSPYFLGGVGFYQPTVDYGDKSSEEKTAFGINGGAGVDLMLNQSIIVGLMGIYHKPFDIKQDNTPPVRGSYFKLLLTAMYVF